MSFIEKIFKFDKRLLKRAEKTTQKVLVLEESMRALSDDELKAKTEFIRFGLKFKIGRAHV